MYRKFDELLITSRLFTHYLIQISDITNLTTFSPLNYVLEMLFNNFCIRNSKKMSIKYVYSKLRRRRQAAYAHCVISTLHKFVLAIYGLLD